MKKLLIGSAIASFIVAGMIGFIVNSAGTLPLSKIPPLSTEMEAKTENGTLTWTEYKEVISIYNAKLEEIRKNCSLDKRCQDGKVNFGAVKDKKDLVRIMNDWIKTSNTNYAK